MKRVFIKTYGCQMNVYDSGRMMDVLNAEGYTQTDAPETADLVLLNTCHIREKAVEKVYSDIGRLNVIKQARALEGKEFRIGVAGCVAQAEGFEIMKRAPAVDLIVGSQSYHRLPELLKRSKHKAIETEFPLDDKFNHLPRSLNAQRAVTAFLTIQEGCDKFCTFCVVPYTRGAEFSRPVIKIIDEAKQLVENGAREITLLGQNVNAYHGLGPDGQEWNLGKLFFALAEIPQLQRLRYMTSHPRDMHDELFEAHRDLPQLMPLVHLPVQSGSDKILKAMNRQHTIRDYLKIIERLRKTRGDLALSSDFIVGFPGETSGDFEASMQLASEVTFASCFSFKYSPRPGTPAADMEQVPEEIKSERLSRLQALLHDQMCAFSNALVGKTLPVLFEKAGRKPGELSGRTPYLQPIEAKAPLHMKGEIADVQVTRAGTYNVFGEIADTGHTETRIAEDAI
jgi:tRNA-2-methylthio-N6-dimethylallyladenosine synthase